MKKALYAVGIGLLVVLSYVAGLRHTARHATGSVNAHRVLYWVDPMHPDYKSDHPGVAPDCGMPLEPVYDDSATAIPSSISLPAGTVGIDQERQQIFGIRVAPVEKSSGTRTLRILGRVVPEDTRVYQINAGTDGFIRETYNDSVGTRVKKDQKLATLYGSEFLPIASGFLAATERVPGAVGKDGSRTMPFPGAVSKQGVSSIQGYADRLRNLGMSDVQMREIAESRQIPESIAIVAPADGFILARNISPGQHFAHSTEFYRIADLSRVWILADIFGSDAQSFRPGAVARVTLPGQRKTFSARVSDVLPQVDAATRTLKLRLEADNPGYALRPDMFVDVELSAPSAAGLTVPVDAVIDSGLEQRVYVQRAAGVFEPRKVETGWRQGDRLQIVRGLAEGERVVAAGTFLVDSESRLKRAEPTNPSAPPLEEAPANQQSQRALAAKPALVKDPACGMMIDPAKATAAGNTLSHQGETYYFCSRSCKDKFSQHPEHSLAMNPSGRRS